MYIGIIVYSQTGNTHSVALKLQEKLVKAGHSANLEQIEISGDMKPGSEDFQLTTKPAVAPYDALIFGSPVQAFSLSQAMKRYLSQIETLQGKKVACFVTKHLPFGWTGGNRSINQMKKLCTAKGGTVCGSGFVAWSSSRREEMMTTLIEKLCRLF